MNEKLKDAFQIAIGSLEDEELPERHFSPAEVNYIRMLISIAYENGKRDAVQQIEGTLQ